MFLTNHSFLRVLFDFFWIALVQLIFHILGSRFYHSFFSWHVLHFCWSTCCVCPKYLNLWNSSSRSSISSIKVSLRVTQPKGPPVLQNLVFSKSSIAKSKLLQIHCKLGRRTKCDSETRRSKTARTMQNSCAFSVLNLDLSNFSFSTLSPRGYPYERSVWGRLQSKVANSINAVQAQKSTQQSVCYMTGSVFENKNSALWWAFLQQIVSIEPSNSVQVGLKTHTTIALLICGVEAVVQPSIVRKGLQDIAIEKHRVTKTSHPAC